MHAEPRTPHWFAVAPPPQMRLRTVEELVGALGEDEWHNLPRWKRIPSLEAGERRGRSLRGRGDGRAGGLPMRLAPRRPLRGCT